MLKIPGGSASTCQSNYIQANVFGSARFNEMLENISVHIRLSAANTKTMEIFFFYYAKVCRGHLKKKKYIIMVRKMVRLEGFGLTVRNRLVHWFNPRTFFLSSFLWSLKFINKLISVFGFEFLGITVHSVVIKL